MTKTRGGSLRRPMHRNGVSCIIQPVKSSPQDRPRLIPRPGSSNSCDLVVVSRRCLRRRRSYWQWWRDCLGIWLCLTVLVSLWFHGRRREEPGPPLVGRSDEPIIATTVQWAPPSRRHSGNAVRSPHNKSQTTTSTGGDDGDGLPNGNSRSIGESRASAAGHPDEPKPSSSNPNASSSQSFDQVFETIWTNHASLDHPLYVLTKRRQQQQQHGSTTNGWEMQGDGVAQLHYCTIPTMTPTSHMLGNPTGLAAGLNATPTTTWQFWKDFSQWAHPLWQRTVQTFERQHAQFHWKNGPNASNRTETTPNQFSAGSATNTLERITHDLQQQVLFQLLELYAQYHDMCQYQSYRPTLPPSVYQQDDWKALVQQLKRPVATTTTRTTTPRLFFVLVAYRDLVMLQHVIAAVHQPQHVILVYLERPPTRPAQLFAQAVQDWIRQSSWSNVVCVTFGTIVYATDSVSQLHWNVWNWYVQQQDDPSSHRRRWFDYYIALDGASFPLWSPQELARQLQIQNQWAWLGPQLHKGQVLGAAAASTNLSSSSSSSLLTSSLGQQSLLLLRRKRLFFTSHDYDDSKNDNDQEEETLYWKWTMRLPAQTFVTHNNNKNNNKQQTHSPTTTTLGALEGDAALVEALVRGGKTHSGNTAIYHESILHSMVHSAQVQELFAKSKYAAYCCMEERIWSAALQLLHLPSARPPPILPSGTQEEDFQQTTARVAPQESATFFPPAVFQTYGGTKPGVCESSKRNAVLMGKPHHRSGTHNTKGIQGEWNNKENDETNKERSNEVLPFCYKLDDVTMVLLDRQGDTNLTKHQMPFVWSSRKPGGGECLEGDPTVILPSSLTKTQHGNSTIHTNAPLDQNPPLIRNSSPALNQCDAYFWSNETLHFLHRARQLGFLFARKFDSSQPDSLQLLQDIQRKVW